MANLAHDPAIRESTIRRTGLLLLANNLLSFGSSEQLAKSNQISRTLPTAMHDLSLDKKVQYFPSIHFIALKKKKKALSFQVRLPLQFLFLATISPNSFSRQVQ